MDRREKSMAFSALADETRLTIIELLSLHQEIQVKELVAATGYSQPNVSKHLAILRIAKVVTFRRDGTGCFYRLNKETIAELRRYVAELQLLALV